MSLGALLQQVQGLGRSFVRSADGRTQENSILLQLPKVRSLATTPDPREIPKVGRSRLRLGQQDRSVLQGVVGNHSFVCVCGEGAKCPPFPHTLQQGPFSLG